MDTPLVNGTAYPTLTVQPTAYRLRILNACNDRNLNLQFYQAKSNAPMWDPATGALLDANAGEVNMVPAIPDAGLPPLWPTDGRDGGVPDPAAIGPTMEQIGTEGGFLPAVAELPNTPVGYEYNRRNIVVLNVTNKTLFLGPAERADVVVDFSQFAGKTIILYNDAPAPVPAFDSRIDYYTGDPDQTMSGGAPSTQPGYGPNTRTIMQIKVASVNPAGDAVSSVSVAHGGQDYTVAPTVAFSGGGGTGAVAATTGSVFDVAVLNPGSGYASPPAVVFSGGGGTGAAADAIVTNGFVTDIVVTNPGSGYTSAPSVALNGGGTGATANASLTVSAIAVTAGGSGYTSVPNVLLMGGGGYGATAIANLALGTPFNLAALQAALPPAFAAAQPAPIVPQAGYNAAYNANYPVDSFVRIQDTSFSFFNGPLTGLTITNAGSGYTTRPSVSITGGGGTGATASAYLTPTVVANITLLTGGSGYTVAPLVKLNGGGGTGAAALATLTGTSIATVSVTARGSGYTSPPQVGFVGGGGSGATAHATIRNGGVQSVVVDTHGTGYIVAPTVTFTGGGGSGATATARLTPTSVASVALTSGGSGYTTAPAVAFSSGGGGTGATAKTSLVPTGVKLLVLTNPGTGYTSAPAVAITGGGGTGATAVAIGVVMGLGPKAIQELFEVNYGRMNAILGAEVPNTTGINQTTIPYNYIDPPNEILKAGDPAAPIGTLADGTQIWKITHNGVDTHAIHFHMFNVQLINRVGWDGMVTPPDANELGWKDTVRMHPLQDAIVAIRPIKPNVPWDLPNSIRLLDPTMPAGSLVGFTNVDPTAQPAVTTNSMVNFGWEYVWHCHLLGHEENDMMRPMIIGVAPIAPSKPTAVVVGAAVKLTWLDKSMNETAWTLQRQDGLTGPWINVATVPGVLGSGSTVTYTDTTVVHLHTYYYRLIANNVVGYTQTYTAPAVGWPHPSFDSGPTARANALTP
jgi:FtsP/CotA-like multicopper oxidase with cupredoxin domain